MHPIFAYTPCRSCNRLRLFDISSRGFPGSSDGLWWKEKLGSVYFQVGGNGGSAIGPLLAALIVIPYGQHAVGWFACAALLASSLLVKVGHWYSRRLAVARERRGDMPVQTCTLPRHTINRAMAILVLMIFSKYFSMPV